MRGGPFPREPVDTIRTAIPEAILAHRTANKLQTHLHFMFFFCFVFFFVSLELLLSKALSYVSPYAGFKLLSQETRVGHQRRHETLENHQA